MDAVWAQEPPDIRRLRETRLPPAGRWGGTLFANLILLWSAQNLQLFRTLAREETVPVDAWSAVVAAYLRQLSVWLAHWHMDDTCGLADDLAGAFEAGCFEAPRSSATRWRSCRWGSTVSRTGSTRTRPWAQLDARLPALSTETAPGLARQR